MIATVIKSTKYDKILYQGKGAARNSILAFYHNSANYDLS